MTFDAVAIGDRIAALHRAAPLVQCLTNAVVMNFTANVLLAAGAAPAMVDIPGEAGPFARVASAVLINLGTPRSEQRSAMLEAVAAATEVQRPWVLDPVAVGSLPVRTALAARLLEFHPTCIRGNPSEVMALAGAGVGGRGVDSVATPDGARAAAQQLALRHHAVVAVSGPVDLITDGTTDIRIGNGSPLLTKVTGGGCALGALTAAFLGCERHTALHAVAAATAAYTIAAEMAAESVAGSGSFAVRLLDALGTLDGDSVRQRLALA